MLNGLEPFLAGVARTPFPDRIRECGYRAPAVVDTSSARE
jgi:hypothetical protein